MVIRLKKWIDRHLLLAFFINFILCCVSAFFMRIYSYYWSIGRYRRFYLFAEYVSLVILLLFFIVTCILFIRLRNTDLLKVKKIYRIDRIKIELYIILLIVGIILGFYLIHPYRFRILGLYTTLDSLFNILSAVFVIGLYCTCMLSVIVMLWRRYRLGILKDTSIILNSIYLYKTRTELEKQLWNKRRFSLWFVILSVIICSVLLLKMGEATGFFGGCLLVIVAVIYIVNFMSLKKNYEIGCIMNHIDAVSRGENIEDILPEKSIFYESDKKLKNIDNAVKEAAKKQLSAERLKMDLITNVSHDLKTPLTSMVAYTDLLKKEDLSMEAMDYVDAISRKQQQLKEMIQSVFELSKSTSGAEVLKIEILDMKILVEQMMADFDERIENAGFSVRVKVEGDNFLFKADNAKMYHVIQNLLENALKYSMQGTRIYIAVEKTVDKKIRFSIKNISSYEIDFNPEQLLERFVRADRARTTKGNGLGLAIVNSYILNMNGKFNLSVDGDLFKAVIEFSEAEKTSEELT